jgi:putative hydrolase of the HAD superfamily
MASHHLRAVFFDAAGTLFTVNGSVGEIYASLAREHGKEVAVADLEAGFHHCFAQMPVMAFPGVRPEHLPELEKQWWRELVRNVFAPLGPFPEFAAYFEALFTRFAQSESWQLYQETRETLAALQHQGFLLGIISNFDSRLFGLLAGLGIARFFDSVVISTQAGAAKPERTIFAHALAVHGLHPDEALHVGDSYEADIVGAQAAGLRPIFVDRRGVHQNTDVYHTVKTLADLIPILERSR